MSSSFSFYLHRRVTPRLRLVALFLESLLFGLKLFDDARGLDDLLL